MAAWETLKENSHVLEVVLICIISHLSNLENTYCCVLIKVSQDQCVFINIALNRVC